MVLSVPVIALGATLGTATSILALCGVTCLCRHMHPKKGLLPRDQDPDPEKAKPGVLRSAQQVSGGRRAVPRLMDPANCDCPMRSINYSEVPLSSPLPSERHMTILPFLTGVVEDVCVMETWNPEKAASWNQAPKLHYCLDYDRQKAELFVTRLEAVTSNHDGGCDCYVQGSVANRTGSVEAQTALKKRQLHTTWEEGLVLPLAEEELPTATLTLTLRTCDRFSRHSVAGELRLGLDGTSVPLGAAQWGELKTSAKEPSAGAGEVLLSISYLPAANRLLVVLIKAKNLHSNQSKELLGKDVFVKVTLKHQARKLKKKQTKRAKSNQPCMIMFELPDDLLQASSVELEVLGQDEAGQSWALGHCSLGLHTRALSAATGGDAQNPRRQIAMWHQLHL
uniref:Synaptotagmin 13 n=1 Tax=Aotus nancymaae TaxID=37293 RepID=A0A2K5FA90_AOTNA